MATLKEGGQPYAPNVVHSIDSSPPRLDLAQPETVIEIIEEEEMGQA
jgi:hypothetical protein